MLFCVEFYLAYRAKAAVGQEKYLLQQLCIALLDLIALDIGRLCSGNDSQELTVAFTLLALRQYRFFMGGDLVATSVAKSPYQHS